jgi:predicted amidohydrolase
MKRLLGQFLVTLSVVALVFHFICWIIGIAGIIAAIVGLGWLAIIVCQRQDAARAREAQRQAGLRARADEQHNWVMAGRRARRLRGVSGRAPVVPVRTATEQT